MVGGVQSFLIDSRWLQKATDLLEMKQEEVIFVIGGGNGQLASLLSDRSRVLLVEPDRSIAQYLSSLGLYRTMVINSDPVLVLRDMPFDRMISLNPNMIDVSLLKGLLILPIKKAVFVMPESLMSAVRSRNMLGTLLRARYKFDIQQHVPTTCFSPRLKEKCSLVTFTEQKGGGNVAAALRLLVKEAGTMRGLLTRSCRQFFGYTLAEAQEAVRMLDTSTLKKRFFELDEKEFKEIYDWLKLE